MRRYQNPDGSLTNAGKQRYNVSKRKLRQLKNKIQPEVKELKNYKGKMYFISQVELDGETMKPRIPKNFFTENGYEDDYTDRVCFAPSVEQCLTALSQNVSGKKFNVYEPDPSQKHTVYKPNEGAVPDSKVTGELWITEPVKVKKVGEIVCTGDDGKDGMPFEYGNHTAELYGWTYEWSKKQ